MILPATLCLCSLVAVEPSREVDQARETIERAIQAHGGAESLGKRSQYQCKTKGIFQGFEKTPVFFFTQESVQCDSGRFRTTLDGELNKQAFRVVNGWDGRDGWIEMSGQGKKIVQACDSAQFVEFQERAHQFRVASLRPLLEAPYLLKAVEEKPLHGRLLNGVRVSHPNHRDVTLFFDKQTGLLAKFETRGTGGTGVEGKLECVYGRYQPVEGIPMAQSWTLYHNDRGLISHHLVEISFLKSIDPDRFSQPKVPK